MIQAGNTSLCPVFFSGGSVAESRSRWGGPTWTSKAARRSRAAPRPAWPRGACSFSPGAASTCSTTRQVTAADCEAVVLATVEALNNALQACSPSACRGRGDRLGHRPSTSASRCATAAPAPGGPVSTWPGLPDEASRARSRSLPHGAVDGEPGTRAALAGDSGAHDKAAGRIATIRRAPGGGPADRLTVALPIVRRGVGRPPGRRR